MANKEERIIIAVAEPSLLEGGADKIYPCITRQDAIKKISSHLLICDISTMDTDEIAEAALNALLED